MSYTCPDANDDIAEVVTAYFANTESGGSADPHAAMCEIREILALLAVEQPATRALAALFDQEDDDECPECGARYIDEEALSCPACTMKRAS